MRFFLALIVVALMAGCASRPPVKEGAFKNLSEQELSQMYLRSEVGKVIFWTDEKFDDVANFTIYGGKYKGQNLLNGNVGFIRSSEAYEIYLPPASYAFWLAFGTMKPQAQGFNIVGGETVYYKWEKIGTKPTQVSQMSTTSRVIGKGSLLTKDELKAYNLALIELNRPDFEVTADEPLNDKVKLKFFVRNRDKAKILVINGVDKSQYLSSSSFEILEKVSLGSNQFNIMLANDDGLDSTRRIVVTRLTEGEKKLALERLRQDKVRAEKEIVQRQLEQERLAKQGDGTPDDLMCKRYGLKPQTPSYAECRMKLDFARTESTRQQQQFEREQAEYERRVAEIQKEREKQRAMRQLELGLRMMSGQSPVDAVSSVGTGAPIAPSRPSPVTQTITLPNGRMVNCTTFGTNTNCF